MNEGGFCFCVPALLWHFLILFRSRGKKVTEVPNIDVKNVGQ